MATENMTWDRPDEMPAAGHAFYRASLGAIVGWFGGACFMLVLGWTLGYAFLGGEDLDEPPAGEWIHMASLGAFAGTFLGAVAGAVAGLLGKHRTSPGGTPRAAARHGSRLH